LKAVELDVLDITPERLGSFDLVLFLGVLYHMKHPLFALERVFSVTREQLILETQIEEGLGSRPAMVFYPGATLNKDPTNWWGPNCHPVLAMLREVGYRDAPLVWTPPIWRSCASAIKGIFSPVLAAVMDTAAALPPSAGRLARQRHAMAVKPC